MKILFTQLESWEKEYFEARLGDYELQFFPARRSLGVSGDDRLLKENLPEDKSADILCVFVGSEIDKDVIDAFPNLKFIATRSTGFDHIDVKYANSKNIPVSSVPNYGMNTVAEFAMTLILALSRKLYPAIRRLKEGSEDFNYEGLKGFDLKDKTLGVIGTGNIGRHVIKMAKGFDMNVIAYDAFPNKDFETQLGFKYVNKLEDLLSQSDIITIHVPLLPSTTHLINKDNIKYIKQGAILVNTARGEIVETEALVLALMNGPLAGAGMDVIEGEGDIKDETTFLYKGHPKEQEIKSFLANHVLMKMDNVLITPHTAFNTQEALERILDTTIENINGYVAGKPINLVKM